MQIPRRTFIGLTGFDGAGRGLATLYLSRRGFVPYSTFEMLIFPEMNRLHLPMTLPYVHAAARDLRTKHSSDCLAYSAMTSALLDEKGRHAVIGNITTPAEIRAMREHATRNGIKFVVYGITADRQVRYDRIPQNGEGTGFLSFEHFAEWEDKEFGSADVFGENVPASMEMVDAIFMNNGTLEDFYRQLDPLMENIFE